MKKSFLRFSSFASLALLVFVTGCMAPVLKAALEGTAKDLGALLDKGANPNTKGELGRPLLHIAVIKGDIKKVKLLLAKKVDVNTLDNAQKSALMYAADRGFSDITDLLIASGADINARTPDSREIAMRKFTPLMFAAQNGHDDIVKTLIAKGADISAQDNWNQSALNWAEKKGHVSVVRILEKAKADKEFSLNTSSGTVGFDEAKMARVMEAAVKRATAAQKPAAAPAPVVIKSDVDEPSYKTPENADNFALVIGIGKYSEIPEAQFAERDAEAVRDHLKAMGYPERNIISLIGQKASKTGMAKIIETWLPLNVTEKSTVFFYYSGHGAPDTKSGQAYLVPWDGDPQFLEDTAYPIKQLYEKLNALKAKRVIVAMDSCFSGAGGRSVLAKGARPLVNKVEMGTIDATGKITAFSASAGEQISGTIEDQGHGAFTYYFLKGLNGAAADKTGAVTVKGLYDYLKPNVQDAARRQNRDQMPSLMPEDPGHTEARIR